MPRSFATLVLAAALSVAVTSCRAPADEETAVTLAKPVADQSGDAAITLVSPAFERAASSLSHLFHVSGGVFGTIDPIDGEILFLDKSGTQLGVARLPDGFMVRDVDVGAKHIVLRGDSCAVMIPRRGAIPAELRAVALPPPIRVMRVGRALRIEHLTVHPRGAGRVLAVSAIGQDLDGRHYVYWEEGGGRQIDAWVGRFGKDGRLSAAAKLDFSDFAEVPAVPVAVVPDGTLLLLEPAEESIQLVQLALGKGLAGARERATGTPAVRVLDLGEDATAKPPDAPAYRPPGPVPEHDAAFGAASTRRARHYLEARWTLAPANFLQSGIADDCEPPEGRYWSRPTRLSEAHVGKAVAAIPYKWGGFDSVEQYKQRLAGARPALAGDVCTCRDDRYDACMVAQSAGIDCSGLVSRAWGLPEHKGTTQLAQMAADLPDLFHLKPGDILNRPGSHVRLFIGFEPGPEVRLRTLESAVSCGGVCERVFTPVQLMAYRPMRIAR
jgi:cell wall-associated NlpC family hydrolase